MKSSSNKKIIMFFSFLLFFVVFTLLVKIVDVQSIGPENSKVGFASINELFHNFLGYNDLFYKISKYLGYLSFLIIGLFGVIGLIQLIKRKSIFKVDNTILILGAFYVLVLFTYAFFEIVIVNYRPVLENGVLEASYPSSHTILSICVCMSGILTSNKIFKDKKIIKLFNICSTILMLSIIVFRTISGVHWLTDIVGGIILSMSLCLLFKYALEKI